MFTIRSSREEDLASITDIYAYYVTNTTYTLEILPPTIEEMKNRRVDVLNKNMPYLVAEQEGLIVGYAYCNWFKPYVACRFTAEISIFLHQKSCGHGLGRALLNALIHEAECAGIRKLIAVIGDSENERSISLHRSAGFSHVCIFKSSGWKFNQWLDMTLMEKSLEQE